MRVMRGAKTDGPFFHGLGNPVGGRAIQWGFLSDRSLPVSVNGFRTAFFDDGFVEEVDTEGFERMCAHRGAPVEYRTILRVKIKKSRNNLKNINEYQNKKLKIVAMIKNIYIVCQNFTINVALTHFREN